MAIQLERKAERLTSLNKIFYKDTVNKISNEEISFEFVPGIRQLYPVHIVEMDFCDDHDKDHGFFQLDAIPDARTRAVLFYQNKRHALDVVSAELIEQDTITYYEVVLKKCEE